VFAARHFLMRQAREPACRFDVVTVQPSGLEWIQGAFDAG
jgi:putative endonuclease